MASIAVSLDDTAVARVAAYTASLPEVEAAPTLRGNLKSGRTLYATCAACHGQHGEGGASLGAPRLANMSDWYLIRQLAAFKAGHRGSTEGKNTTVTAWVRNLADKDYLVGAYDIASFGWDQWIVGEPRTYGVTLQYRLC